MKIKKLRYQVRDPDITPGVEAQQGGVGDEQYDRKD